MKPPTLARCAWCLREEIPTFVDRFGVAFLVEHSTPGPDVVKLCEGSGRATRSLPASRRRRGVTLDWLMSARAAWLWAGAAFVVAFLVCRFLSRWM